MVRKKLDEREPGIQGPRRLLVVEDHERHSSALWTLVDKVTRARGWEALFLSRVCDAESVLHRASVDVVLSDFHLHDGLGTSLTRRARATDRPGIGILLTSDPSAVERALVEGREVVDDVWHKEWSLRSIEDRLDATLTRAELNRSHA